MSEESAYSALSMGLLGDASVSSDGGPDLPGLFPSLVQDQEPFSSTDLPLPVSGPAEDPVMPPVSSEAPLASETASEESEGLDGPRLVIRLSGEAVQSGMSWMRH